MDRIKEKVELIWGKHKHIICFSAMLIFLLGLALFIFKTNIYPASKEPYAAIENAQNQTPTAKLQKGDVWSQTFTASTDEISGAAVKVATYQRVNTGEIRVEIRNLDTGATAYNQKIAMNELVDNSYEKFMFHQPLQQVKGNQFEIVITVLSAGPEDQLSIWMSKDDSYEEGNSEFNGTKLIGDASFRVYTGDNSYLIIIFLISSGVLLLALCLIYYLVFIRKIKVSTTFLVAAGILGLAYSLMMTPCSIPDERAHLETAYRYSNQLLFLGHETNDGNMLMRQEDADILQNSLYQNPSAKTYKFVADNFFQSCHDNTLIEVSGRDVGTSKFVYIPTAVGMTIGRLLNLGFIPVLYLGRLLNFAFYVALVYFAIKKMPIAKMILFTVALLPMSIHQAASLSSDGVIMALAFFFIATLVKMAYGEEKVKLLDIILLCLAGSWLTLCKDGAYVPLCFLVLLIPARNFISKKQHLLVKGTVIFLVIALFAANTILPMLLGSGGEDISSGYTLGWALHNPFGFVRILVKTFIDTSDFYIRTMTGGLLGWLNIPVPNYVGTACIILLLISCLRVDNEHQLIKASHKLWIFVVVVGAVICTEIGLFISWTPFGSNSIEGVQGRYFLPILPAALLLIRNSNITLKRDVNKYIILTAFFLNLIEMGMAFREIISY